MKNFHQIFLYICLLTGIFLQNKVLAQQPVPRPDAENSHKLYIHYLRSAENRSYEDILAKYNHYLARHPNDISTRIEKCKFIGNSFYNSYDEYNPKQAEFDTCLNDLYTRFPAHPDVLIYKSEFLYGDSAISFLENMLQQAEKEPDLWEDQPMWKVYENLANQYNYKEAYEKSIFYAKEAVIRNDTLDLSLLLARQYKAIAKKDDAIEILKQNIDSLQPAWILNQKAELLLDLNESALALELFRYAQKDTTAWTNASSIGKALEQNYEYAEARKYFVKAVKNNPAHYTALENLFLHDLYHQTRDSVAISYHALRDLGYKADPLGKNRLLLLFNYPDIPWQWRDLTGILGLLAFVAVLLLLPYLWILPVYFIGSYFKRDEAHTRTSFRWGLKSFWAISSIYLLITFLVLVFYNYAELILLFNDDLFVSIGETVSDKITADSNLLFFVAMAFGTLLLLRKSDFTYVWTSAWPKRKMLVAGLLTALAVRFAYGWSFILIKFLFPEGLDMGTGQFEWLHLVGAVDTEILALRNEYGLALTFFFIALLVPVYEEIIFRGIILASCEKYIHFFWANMFQSLLFAAIHQKPVYFIFYFVMGMVSGYLCATSKGLAASISFHVVNNFIALLVILK